VFDMCISTDSFVFAMVENMWGMNYYINPCKDVVAYFYIIFMYFHHSVYIDFKKKFSSLLNFEAQ